MRAIHSSITYSAPAFDAPSSRIAGFLLAAVCAAPTALAQAPGDLALAGPSRAVSYVIPGVGGRLEIEPLLFVTRSQIEAALRGGFVPPGFLLVQPVRDHGGFLALGPSRSLAALLDGDISLRHLAIGPSGDSGEQVRPSDCRVTLRLSSEPAHSNFTRHLRFRDEHGADEYLALAFSRSSGLTFEADLVEGIGVLEDLVDTGERSHWDSMALVNRGGTTELSIAHLSIVLDYEVTDFYRGSVSTTVSIALVDRTIGRTLASGTAELPLNDAARATKRAVAGIDTSAPAPLLAAVHDLGKSGSDGGSGDNPKYGGATELLCSEFVSWYYHQAGVSVTSASNEFRDIVGTQQLHDLFEGAGRLYRYHSGRQRFEDPVSGGVYTPGPGDFLEWRKDGEAMHAMMLLRYDSSSKVATVVNGPWPVRLMDVDLQWWETATSAEFDFWIGSIPR
jgi:hypothetical protein